MGIVQFVWGALGATPIANPRNCASQVPKGFLGLT